MISKICIKRTNIIFKYKLKRAPDYPRLKPLQPLYFKTKDNNIHNQVQKAVQYRGRQMRKERRYTICISNYVSQVTRMTDFILRSTMCQFVRIKMCS